MNLSSFPPKKQGSDWQTYYLVYQLEAYFLAGNDLYSCPDLELREIDSSFYSIVLYYQYRTSRIVHISEFNNNM